MKVFKYIYERSIIVLVIWCCINHFLTKPDIMTTQNTLILTNTIPNLLYNFITLILLTLAILSNSNYETNN